MDYNADTDLYLFSSMSILGKDYGLVKICDDNIYVNSSGGILRDAQWFFFQLVEIVKLLLTNANGDNIIETIPLGMILKNQNGTDYKGGDPVPKDILKNESDVSLVFDTKTGKVLNKVEIRDKLLLFTKEYIFKYQFVNTKFWILK